MHIYNWANLLICGNEILTSIKHHNSVTNLRNIMRNNPNLDLVNVIAYIYFDEIKDHNSFTNLRKITDNNYNLVNIMHIQNLVTSVYSFS